MLYSKYVMYLTYLCLTVFFLFRTDIFHIHCGMLAMLLVFHVTATMCPIPHIIDDYGFRSVLANDSSHFGTLLTYTCREGFTLIGHPSAVCLTGVWSNDPPSCQRT